MVFNKSFERLFLRFKKTLGNTFPKDGLAGETVEPSGVQVLKNPNPLKDVEVSAMLDVVVLV